MKKNSRYALLCVAIVLTSSPTIAADEKTSRKPTCYFPPPSVYSVPHSEESAAFGWASEVKQAINRTLRKSFPIEKSVHCHLLVEEDGSIKLAKILKSSGDPQIDQRALDFLKAQSPLPKPRNVLAQQTGLRIWFKPEIGTVDVVSEAWLQREHPDK